MRDSYDFSNGVRGKYAGKVNTSDIRIIGSTDTREAGSRDLDGEIRRKRGDTLVGTLRKTYGPDFAPGVRSDMRLDTLRKKAGTQSLLELLKAK